MNNYSGIYEPSPAAGGGIGPEVVRILRAYNRELPLPFLAHLLHRSVGELSIDIQRLEKQQIVRRVGDQVQLAA